MAEFILSPSAEADLDEIWHYIAERNEAAAGKFIRDLIAKFELLADNREIGKRQDDFSPQMRMFPFKNYNVYYFPNKGGIEIYRVLHGKRDLEELFDDYFEGSEE